MTDSVTSRRGDRVAYDRYGPMGGGPALVVVALRAVVEVAGGPGRAGPCGHLSGSSISPYAAAQGVPVEGLVCGGHPRPRPPRRPGSGSTARAAHPQGEPADFAPVLADVVRPLRAMP